MKHEPLKPPDAEAPSPAMPKVLPSKPEPGPKSLPRRFRAAVVTKAEALRTPTSMEPRISSAWSSGAAGLRGSGGLGGSGRAPQLILIIY